MRYKNIETGFIRDFSSNISSPFWVLANKEIKKELTKNEIIEKLDSLGIKYKPTMTKDKLKELLEGN